MFGKLDKTVYSTLLGAILFYEKLAVQLHKWGYIMNPYDACTFNKMVNDKQITVYFFVDDLHINCKNLERRLNKTIFSIFSWKIEDTRETFQHDLDLATISPVSDT